MPKIFKTGPDDQRKHNGGYRPGAGRPAGSKKKKPKKVQVKMYWTEDTLERLDYMLIRKYGRTFNRSERLEELVLQAIKEQGY